MKKIIVGIIIILAIFVAFAACENKIPEETQEIIENSKTAAKEITGGGKTFADVKKLIASILDYNNIVDSSDSRVQVKFKDEIYSKVEDLTYLLTFLDETKVYKIQTAFDKTTEIPSEILIEEDETAIDLIEGNSVNDEIRYEENVSEVSNVSE